MLSKKPCVSLEKENLSFFEIRKAGNSDFGSVFELSLYLSQSEYNKFDKTLKLAWLRDKEGKEYVNGFLSLQEKCCFLAFHNSKPIGYLFGEILEKEEHAYREINTYAELTEIFVLEGYQNQRIGTQLIENFFDWCSSKGVDKIKVDVLSQNMQAIDFYKRKGFGTYCATMELNLNQIKTEEKELNSCTQTIK